MTHTRKSKKNWGWWLVALTLIVGGGSYYYYRVTNQIQYEMIRVTKGDVISEVTVTGRIKSADSVGLAFEKGGKIKMVHVKVGDRVSPGQALATLDTSELQAQLMQAEANVETQTAKLDELKRGTRIEEIQVKNVELKKAEQDLVNYYGSIVDVVNDAYAKADDAVRTKTDQLFINDDSDAPQPTFMIVDSQVLIDVVNSRKASSYELRTWKKELSSVSSTPTHVELDAVLAMATDHLYIFRDYLGHALDAFDKSSGLSSTDIGTYKANIAVGRANISSAISAITSQQQLISTQQVVIERIKNELALLYAGSTPESIAAQEAQVKQAEASVSSIRAQIMKSTLFAPISGVVTKQDAKQGEIAAPNTQLISIIAEKNLEIEANVPEIDVGRIMVGNPVRVTLDAFPSELFAAHVTYIDPAETVVDGVVNFKVTIVFDKENSKFRSGLTANLEIESIKKTGVLVLPEYALVEGDSGVFVKILHADGTTEDLPVKIGIRSNDGKVEIIEGVSYDDEVINVGLKTGVKK